MALPWAAIAGAAMQIGGSVMDNYQQTRANQANMDLAKYQHEANIEMWNMQNEYNSPEKQMFRLKKAGLNPNLVYGNGSAVGNTTSNAPQFQAPTIKPYTGFSKGANDAVSSYLSSQMTSSQLKNMQEQNANLVTQRDAMKQQLITEGLRQAELAVKNSRSDFDLQLAKDLRTTSLEAAQANVEKTKAEVDKTKVETKLREAEIDFTDIKKELTESQRRNLDAATAKLKQDTDFQAFEQDLKRMGIYPGDALWERIVGRIIKSTGLMDSDIDIDVDTDLVGKISKGYKSAGRAVLNHHLNSSALYRLFK